MDGITKKASLEDLLSCGEVLSSVTSFLDATSALELSRASVSLYLALARNTPLGISIWRRYLTDLKYVPNRLVFDVGKTLVETADVSRANFKLVVAVLSQKSGFMKINKLKALCASGKLNNPLLPRKGQWRALVRLDPFALKRATAEGNQQNRPEVNVMPPRSTPSIESLIIRMVGSRSKSPLLEQQLVRVLAGNPDAMQSTLSSIFSALLANNQFPGVCDLIEMVLKLSPPQDREKIERIISNTVVSFRTSIGDTILHALIRVTEFDLCGSLLKHDMLRPLLNTVNLNHETPLLLLFKQNKSAPLIADLIQHGADTSIPDKKGNLYNLS